MGAPSWLRNSNTLGIDPISRQRSSLARARAHTQDIMIFGAGSRRARAHGAMLPRDEHGKLLPGYAMLATWIVNMDSAAGRAEPS
jgi:hypothetical protein